MNEPLTITIREEELRTTRLLKNIYEGLSYATTMVPFKHWHDNILLVFPARIGGIVVRRLDSDHFNCWSVDIYTPNCLPRLKKLRGIIAACAIAGCDFLILDKVAATYKLAEKLGFQSFPSHYALDLRIKH